MCNQRRAEEKIKSIGFLGFFCSKGKKSEFWRFFSFKVREKYWKSDTLRWKKYITKIQLVLLLNFQIKINCRSPNCKKLCAFKLYQQRIVQEDFYFGILRECFVWFLFARLPSGELELDKIGQNPFICCFHCQVWQISESKDISSNLLLYQHLAGETPFDTCNMWVAVSELVELPQPVW